MSSGHSGNGKMKGILTDVTKCIGCERCVEACVQANKLPRDVPAHYKAKDGLSGRRLTSIVKIAGKSAGEIRNVRRQCMHCIDPACKAACLVGAFDKREDGPVVYDADKCIGCRYCMLACPFMVPRYEWDKPVPYVVKCKMNEECRASERDNRPSCVAACPTGATIFGDRDDLIKEARDRIKKDPGKYIDHIWGESEFGGTSVMYISDVPLGDALKIPDPAKLKKMAAGKLSTQSIPHQVEPWVWWTPFQFIIFFSGIMSMWFLKRRSHLMSGGDGEHGAAGPEGAQTAFIDEVCHDDGPGPDSGKEGE